MPQLAQKPLIWFKINDQVRKSFDEEDLRRLGESMKAHGQLQQVGRGLTGRPVPPGIEKSQRQHDPHLLDKAFAARWSALMPRSLTQE
jgi:hypothetical protein